MKITRKSALKTIGTALGSATLLGFTKAPTIKADATEQASKKTDFNVLDYGAKGDGTTNDTDAINQTIAAAAETGGGKVVFPSGTYLSGSVHLKSNITLYLGQGAVLEATDDPKTYDPAEPFEGPQYQDFGHSHWHNSLIWGEGLHDIAIIGPGMIHGKGLLREEADDKSAKRPGNKAIALKECRNVLLRDFTVNRGGWFVLLATGVDHMTIDNLTIDTNRDGLDIDCCRNVRASNCMINAPFDDAICLKSSYALGYARPSQDLVITNCTVSGFKIGSVLDQTYKPSSDRENNPSGRIKFGTESNGGFKNITISNCTFDHCRGIALLTVDGGLLEDVSISNITMRDVGGSPIFMRLGSRMRGPEDTPIGKLRRINISNVVVHNAAKETGVLISGIPGHLIEDVKISNIQLHYEGGGTEQDAALQPPENLHHYPKFDIFGTLPSYGMFLRHVKGIEVTNAKLRYAKKDMRPPFALDDVEGADFRFIKGQHEPDTPTFSLQNTTEFHVFESGSLENQTLNNVKKKRI